MTTTETDLEAAVRRLAEAMHNIGPGPFDHATCSEAEAIADVLRAGGYDTEAAWVIADHADGDTDCDDAHHDLWLKANERTRAQHGCDEEPDAPGPDTSSDPVIELA